MEELSVVEAIAVKASVEQAELMQLIVEIETKAQEAVQLDLAMAIQQIQYNMLESIRGNRKTMNDLAKALSSN